MGILFRHDSASRHSEINFETSMSFCATRLEAEKECAKLRNDGARR